MPPDHNPVPPNETGKSFQLSCNDSNSYNNNYKWPSCWGNFTKLKKTKVMEIKFTRLL